MAVKLGNAHLSKAGSPGHEAGTAIDHGEGHEGKKSIFHGADGKPGREPGTKVLSTADPHKAGNIHAGAAKPGHESGTKIDGYAGNKTVSGTQAAPNKGSYGVKPEYHGKLANEVNTTRGADGHSSTAPGALKGAKRVPATVAVKTPIALKGKAGKIGDNQHGNKSPASILYPE